MVVARNRSELQDVAHPGHLVVYRQTTDGDGKKIVVPHTLPEIDARDAVARFPNEYSLLQPENAGPLVHPSEVGLLDPYALAPAAPAISSQGTAMGPIVDGTVQQPAAVTESAEELRAREIKALEVDVATAEADFANAKKDDKPAAQAKLDEARAKLDDDKK